MIFMMTKSSLKSDLWDYYVMGLDYYVMGLFSHITSSTRYPVKKTTPRVQL